ncbi:hypothetical protein [Leptospira santarosai]|uniref:Uncharacterized protein n=1 Tax=Leptospira santarosai str. ZUN179 TaxID=1049985 RepID=M6V024_9LEPT|nr:hypothetical protein [Leptospira santarosai]EMO46589.1 hypothetical protein LEP1GSC187_2031 [Leptospira santarosai str. ZUN179]MDI7230510.1 hypothetical protein [Leptospira santarosai]
MENVENKILDKKEIISRKYFLKGKTIGISISESEDFEELGYSLEHLRDAIVEIARYIANLGGRLAYGGDLRHGGFAELLFDILAYYKADKQLEPYERLISFLAYPISLTLTSSKEAELKNTVTFRKIPPPDDIVHDLHEYLKPDSSENLYIWFRSLTMMREEMESQCDARVFIGGKIKEYKGKCPGIMEELFIAVNNNHPVYLIGAFGGVTRDIISSLKNERTESFSNEFHLEDNAYTGAYAKFNEKHPEDVIDFEKYFTTFRKVGVKGVANLNGLSEAENERLFVTPHLNEIVFLILKGLAKRFIP